MDVHVGGLSYKTISNNLGKKLMTAGAIISKYETSKMAISLLKSQSCLVGVRMIRRKVMDQPTAMLEELNHDLKAAATIGWTIGP